MTETVFILIKNLRNDNVGVTHLLLGESSKNWVTIHQLLEKLQFLRWSRNSLYSVDSIDLVPCWHEAASWLWSELDKFSPHSHSCSSEIHFNIIILCLHRYKRWFLIFRFYN